MIKYSRVLGCLWGMYAPWGHATEPYVPTSFVVPEIKKDLSYQSPVLEDLVTSWAKDHIGYFSHLEKIAFKFEDLQDIKGSQVVVSLWEPGQKTKIIRFKNLPQYFHEATVNVDITYGKSKIDVLKNETIELPDTASNYTINSIKSTIITPALYDSFSWKFNHFITSLPLKSTLQPCFIELLEPQQAILQEGIIFKAAKNKAFPLESAMYEIPAKTKLASRGIISKVAVTTDFKATLAFNLNFAVVYKDWRKKQRIDLYPIRAISSVLPKDGCWLNGDTLCMMRDGIFKGVYVTQYQQDNVMIDIEEGRIKKRDKYRTQWSYY